jgi:hypothetical protein
LHQVRTAKAFEAFVAAAQLAFPVVKDLSLDVLPSGVLPPGYEGGESFEEGWVHKSGDRFLFAGAARAFFAATCSHLCLPAARDP